jgi:hypothetical protein
MFSHDGFFCLVLFNNYEKKNNNGSGETKFRAYSAKQSYSFKFDFDYAYSLIHQILKIPPIKFQKSKTGKISNSTVTNYMLKKLKDITTARADYNKYLDFLHKNNIIWRTNFSEGVL